jgi:uncharacterized Ntn-hydrolase superfamily protein
MCSGCDLIAAYYHMPRGSNIRLADNQNWKGWQTMRSYLDRFLLGDFRNQTNCQSIGGRALSKTTRILIVSVTLTLSIPLAARQLKPDSSSQPWNTVATFSILGFDPDTEEIGAAVQSRVFSVGNGVLWAEAGIGAVATQAIVDVSYGPQGIELLKKGMAPKDILRKILDSDTDPRPTDWTKQGRQFAVINARGEVAAYTGVKAPTWAGDKQGKYCTAQGNILAGEAVVANMVKAFETTKGHISLRLQAALEAGQAAGGDTRGMQSAAMIVVKKGGGVWLNNDVVLRLQVDDNPRPIQELRRLVEIAARQRRPRG